jgi:outer membrane protein assembly factor BamB
MSDEIQAAAEQSTQAAPRRMSLWPPILFSLLCAACMFLPTRISEGSSQALMMVMFFGPIVSLLLFLIWWLGFSKAPWSEKFIGLGAVIAAFALAAAFAHPSMGMGIMMYMPILLLVGWTFVLVMFRGNPGVRRFAIPISLIPAVVLFSLVRFNGVTGEFDSEMSWRWTKTAEDEYLASRSALKPAKKTEAPADSVKPLTLAAGDWPAFRGPNRDGILRGVKIRTDWNKNPPKQLWRSKIGPGWSSITVVGDYGFTQEQRGPEEVVACFNIGDGSEVWSNIDKTRFEEPVAGAGPRATPTFADGKLFTLGANGMLNAFDAATGKKLWSHDLVKMYETKLKEELDPKGMKTAIPMWGFSASPLVYGDKVAVYVGAKDKGVAVFNVTDGKEVWSGGFGGHSYVSSHLAKVAGAETLINTSNKGVQGLDPSTGKQLWNHEWLLGDVVPCVQPTVLGGDRIALGAAFGLGTRVFNVTKGSEESTTKELATHVAFKPYYSDYVTIGDVAYGFDGSIFGCFDLETGKRLWKGGRYGSGQVLLLADQNLLLVISETDGNVVLIPAEKTGHKEVAKFKALTGKTWNHPVVAHGKLLVRNGEEIACFDVSEK